MEPRVPLLAFVRSPKSGDSLIEPNGFLVSGSSPEVRASLTEPNGFLDELREPNPLFGGNQMGGRNLESHSVAIFPLSLTYTQTRWCYNKVIFFLDKGLELKVDQSANILLRRLWEGIGLSFPIIPYPPLPTHPNRDLPKCISGFPFSSHLFLFPRVSSQITTAPATTQAMQA